MTGIVVLVVASLVVVVLARSSVCRHRDVMFDRVNGRAVWRCVYCSRVRERGGE